MGSELQVAKVNYWVGMVNYWVGYSELLGEFYSELLGEFSDWVGSELVLWEVGWKRCHVDQLYIQQHISGLFNISFKLEYLGLLVASNSNV